MIVRMYLAEYAPEILGMMPILKNFVAFFVLAAIVAAIWGLGILAKRLARSARLGGREGLVRVIHRAYVSPRQSILLVQVAERVLVVGVSGHEMHLLCEITDPFEVTNLRARAAGMAASMAAQRSQRLPWRVIRPWRTAPPDAYVLGTRPAYECSFSGAPKRAMSSISLLMRTEKNAPMPGMVARRCATGSASYRALIIRSLWPMRSAAKSNPAG